MKKNFKVLIVLLIVFLTTGCGKTYMKEISYKEYHNLLDNKESFILEIMSDTCSACESFKPNIEEVANEYKIEIKYINTNKLSKEDVDKLYDETGIKGTPTVIFYDNGVEETISSRINGSIPVKKIITTFKANGIIKED